MSERERFDVQAYRAENKRSRATGRFTVYGSGSSVRRYTCVCCREVVATESAKWGQTAHAAKSMRDHVCAAAEPYMREIGLSAEVCSCTM